MKQQVRLLALVSALAVAGAISVMGQPNQLWTFDEFGNATFNGSPWQLGQLMPDPTGGVPNWNVLVYNLPFAGVAGDVLMHDPLAGNGVLDVLRFDGNFQLIFYSDNVDGYEAPADTPSAPSPLLGNQANITEQGPEGGYQWGDYSPLVGQPGWDPSNPSYSFISDVPEPGTGVLLVGGMALLGARFLRRKQVS